MDIKIGIASLVGKVVTPKSGSSVEYLGKALELAKRNPQAYEIITDVYKGKNLLNIVRRNDNSSRVATYNILTGKLRGIVRYSHSEKCRLTYRNGTYSILDYMNSSGEFLKNKFKNLGQMLSFFREELPKIYKK